MKKINGHQGDVQFKTVGQIPQNARKIENKPLAYGEISGHAHVLTGKVDLFELDGKIYAVVGNDGARLQHIKENHITPSCMISTKELPVADHKSILLPPGTYEFGIQKQYDPFEDVFKRVVD
ncbi:MAG: hypothetical protein WC389_16630 [Lutibacter sp.]|jgi:hypothetical protein